MSMVPAFLTGTVLPLLKKVGSNLVGRSDLRPNSGNLMSFTKQTRVEPIVLIDQRLSNDPELGSVLQGLLSFFAATYLQAVALITPVGKINPRRALDSLNPERSVGQSTRSFFNDMYAVETLHTEDDFRFGLPSMQHFPSNEAIVDANKIATVLGGTPTALRSSQKAETTPTTFSKNNNTTGSKELNDLFSKNANLSVGRILDVEIGDGTATRMIPVQFRLISTLIPANVLTHILGAGSKDIGVKETWHDWRSKGGGFSGFWRDVVMADQLVKEHRETLLKDKTGTFQEILERRRGNVTSSVLSGNPSLATAANMVILSAQSAKDMETKFGAKLEDYRSRQRIFDSTYVMILVVMDQAWNRVTYYHAGVKLPTHLSFNELKTANKGNGIDVEAVLKAMLLGNQIPV